MKTRWLVIDIKHSQHSSPPPFLQIPPYSPFTSPLSFPSLRGQELGTIFIIIMRRFSNCLNHTKDPSSFSRSQILLKKKPQTKFFKKELYYLRKLTNNINVLKIIKLFFQEFCLRFFLNNCLNPLCP